MRPRWPTGTWSGSTATTAASSALKSNWAMHQPIAKVEGVVGPEGELLVGAVSEQRVGSVGRCATVPDGTPSNTGYLGALERAWADHLATAAEDFEVWTLSG